jgi:hypothetical protein
LVDEKRKAESDKAWMRKLPQETMKAPLWIGAAISSCETNLYEGILAKRKSIEKRAERPLE